MKADEIMELADEMARLKSAHAAAVREYVKPGGGGLYLNVAQAMTAYDAARSALRDALRAAERSADSGSLEALVEATRES